MLSNIPFDQLPRQYLTLTGCDILAAMDKENMRIYTEFLDDPLMDGWKFLDEIQNTPFIGDYGQKEIPELAKQVDHANRVIPFVNTRIVGQTSYLLLTQGYDKLNSLFGAIQMCLHPTTATRICETFGLTEMSDLMVAASHIGTVKMSEIFQDTHESGLQQIRTYSLYFAVAQARLLGFRTSTSLLAMDPEDKGLLRLEPISVIATVKNVEQLKKDQVSAIFGGHKVSGIRESKGGKFFTLG